MTGQHWRRGTAAVLILVLILPLIFQADLYAEEKVVEQFYVLDEEGDPVLVEITQADLDRESREGMTYQVQAYDEEEEIVVGEYDDLGEAQDACNDMAEFLQEVSVYGTEESEQNVRIVDENGNVVTTTEDVIGIVRFQRDQTTFSYKETDSGRTGYMSPNSAADAAFIRREEDGIVCKISGVVIKVAADRVASIESYQDNTLSYYYYSDGYLIHKIGYYSGDALATSSTRVGPAPSYISKDTSYYSYDGNYFYDSFEQMIQDYRNDTYTHAVNSANPYYNYYQYLSFHTTAGFTGSQYDTYIEEKKGNDSVMLTTGDLFVKVQDKRTINSVLMYGIAINESGWGTSNLAKEKNNLFGLNAVDSNPYESGKSFSSLEACIDDFAYGWIHSGYLNGTDFRYRGAHLGNKRSGINVKYASDPYWGEKGSARPYYFDTKQTDYGRYTIGIAKSSVISLYQEADSAGTVLYTSEAGEGGKLYDYSVTILDTVTNSKGETFYMIASDMALKEDRTERNVTDIYNSSRDYVYAKASDIQIVFQGSGKDVTVPDPGESSDEKTQEEILNHLKLTNSQQYLTGFTLGGDVSSVIRSIQAFSETAKVVIRNKNGTQVTSGLLTTGMTMAITTGGRTVSYQIVLRGDTNGDGKISALDYVKVRNHLDRVTTLTGVYLQAADASGDGKVSALDYVKIRNHLDQKSMIVQ